MKKSIFIALLSVALVSPLVTRAQVFSPDQQSSLDALKQEIIDLLTQEIASLQAQIQQVLANQATQQTQINNISQPISFGSVNIPATTTTAALGSPVCVPNHIFIPLTVSSSWQQANFNFLVYVSQNNAPATDLPKHATFEEISPKDGGITLSNWADTYDFTGTVYGDNGITPIASLDQTISVSACQ